MINGILLRVKLQIFCLSCVLIKKVLTRKNRPLWINQDIFRSIRERKRLLKLYRITGNSNTF